MEYRQLRFSEDTTQGTSNKYNKSTTVKNPPVDDKGRAYPYHPDTRRTGKNAIPYGSYNRETGQFTGDFRGLGTVNPWGGKKSKKNRKKRRKQKRRTYRNR